MKLDAGAVVSNFDHSMNRIVATAVALLALASVSFAQTSFGGKSQTQALKMNFAKWDQFVQKSPNGLDPFQYAKGMKFYLSALQNRNDKLMKKSPKLRKNALLGIREAYGAAATKIHQSGIQALGGDLEPAPQLEVMKIQVEVGIYRSLTKAKMPKALVTGNQFREILDVFSEETLNEAKKNNRVALVTPLLEDVDKTTIIARELLETVSEGEGIMLRQLLAHWLAPEAYNPPFNI